LCDSNTSFITTICWRTCGEEGARAVVSVCMLVHHHNLLAHLWGRGGARRGERVHAGPGIRTLCGRHRGRTKAL
jgi:hypothetical protein